MVNPVPWAEWELQVTVASQESKVAREKKDFLEEVAHRVRRVRVGHQV